MLASAKYSSGILLLPAVRAGILANSAELQLRIPTRGVKRGTKPITRFEWDMEHLEKITEGKYTHMPLRVNKLGGRDPETKHRTARHVGGGIKFDYWMIDLHRRGPSEPNKTYDERVLEVRRDPNRTAHIALVAGQRGKRWILATENMVAGQIISTSAYIPENPLMGIEGHCYALGALAPGNLVNSVECYPSPDSKVVIINAGGAAEVVRHQGEFVVVKMPHQHEYAFLKTCMATVGRLSHGDFAKKQFGSPNIHRRFGFMPNSGLYQKKDCYQGRRIRPLPPVKIVDSPEVMPEPKMHFTLTRQQLSALFGPAKIHPLLAKFEMRL